MVKFKIKWEHLNNVLDSNIYISDQIYTICKNNNEDNDIFPYTITYNINQYDVITKETMVNLHRLSIEDIMKEEKDLYELNINWFDCIIWRSRWHLNWYVSLIKEWYYDLDIIDLNVHWWITYQWDIHIIWLNKNYYDRKFIWFDTAHAWDAFLEEWFDYTLETWTYKKYDYVYNQLEELTNQIKNKSWLKKTDWQRYLEAFINKVKDYKNLSIIEFYIKYCLSLKDLDSIKELYEQYAKCKSQLEDDLSYDDWLEEVYYEENKDNIDTIVYEYRDPNLDCILYKDQNTSRDYRIYEVTLAVWWHNIFVTLSSRWNNVKYEFIWWWEKIEENLSYMYDDIFNYLNLDSYE